MTAKRPLPLKAQKEKMSGGGKRGEVFFAFLEPRTARKSPVSDSAASAFWQKAKRRPGNFPSRRESRAQKEPRF
jgi:hypothetical protein